MPSIGPLTASALIASIGDAKNFDNGRQLAAWLGMVPRQHSSRGKPTLLGMSKRGDAYLRTMLIHGARSATNPGGVTAARWQTFRLFLMPFCVSSFATLIKGRHYVLVFPSDPALLGRSVLVCAAFVLACQGLRAMRTRLAA